MKRGKTQIYSIFGQIEGVVADAMAAEGIVRKIDRNMIPATARFNDRGDVAHCALVLTPELERVFDERVANLRA